MYMSSPAYFWESVFNTAHAFHHLPMMICDGAHRWTMCNRRGIKQMRVVFLQPSTSLAEMVPTHVLPCLLYCAQAVLACCVVAPRLCTLFVVPAPEFLGAWPKPNDLGGVREAIRCRQHVVFCEADQRPQIFSGTHCNCISKNLCCIRTPPASLFAGARPAGAGGRSAYQPIHRIDVEPGVQGGAVQLGFLLLRPEQQEAPDERPSVHLLGGQTNGPGHDDHDATDGTLRQNIRIVCLFCRTR